jgi:hypothetical protein
MRSAELLLPSIRGVETLYPAEPVDANAAVIRITDRGRGRLPVAYVTARRYRQRFGHENVINLLPSSALTNLRAIGDGNVNVTLFLEFRLPDGRRVKGVFKPFFGQNGYGRAVPDLVSFTREIQASDFYYEFFQHPRIIFPETRELIVTTVDRSYGVGSFQLFLEGFRTVNEMYGGHDGRPVPPASPRYIEVWDRQRLDPRWSDVGPWIAVYDYLLGNTDRFQNSRRTWGNPNNIMVRELDGGRSLEIGLIDTGNGRRIRPDGEFGLRDIPDPRTYSPQLIEAVTRADTEINRIRDSYGKVLSTNGVDDLATRIQQVRQKIRSDLGR